MAKLIDITARYPGRCHCGTRIAAGARIKYDPNTKSVFGCRGCLPRRVATVSHGRWIVSLFKAPRGGIVKANATYSSSAECGGSVSFNVTSDGIKAAGFRGEAVHMSRDAEMCVAEVVGMYECHNTAA